MVVYRPLLMAAGPGGQCPGGSTIGPEEEDSPEPWEGRKAAPSASDARLYTAGTV